MAEGTARVAQVAAQVPAGVAGALVSLGSAQRLLELVGRLVGGAVVEIEIEISPERISGWEADSGAVLMVGSPLGG